MFVAYAPSRPGLGVLADEDKERVERQLSEPALGEFWAGAWGIAWVVGVIALLVTMPWSTRSLRFPGRLKGDEHALSARVVGHELRPQVGNVLLLRTDAGDLSLFVHESHQRYFDAFGQASGWLVWHPERNRRRGFKAPDRLSANFVTPAGWHIAGELAYKDMAPAEAEATEPQVDAARQARLLDIQAAWPLTVRPVAVWCAFGMALCAVVLTLPVDMDGWRLALGLTGTFVPLIIGVSLAMRHAMAEDKAHREAQGDGAPS